MRTIYCMIVMLAGVCMNTVVDCSLLPLTLPQIYCHSSCKMNYSRTHILVGGFVLVLAVMYRRRLAEHFRVTTGALQRENKGALQRVSRSGFVLPTVYPNPTLNKPWQCLDGFDGPVKLENGIVSCLGSEECERKGAHCAWWADMQNKNPKHSAVRKCTHAANEPIPCGWTKADFPKPRTTFSLAYTVDEVCEKPLMFYDVAVLLPQMSRYNTLVRRPTSNTFEVVMTRLDGPPSPITIFEGTIIAEDSFYLVFDTADGTNRVSLNVLPLEMNIESPPGVVVRKLKGAIVVE